MAHPKHLILIILLFSGFNLPAQSWKTYPYHEEGTLIYFPQDEGRHPSEPTEWWYANGFLTGVNSGKEYSFMVSYFYYPAFGFDGFRIFNIADETEGQFYPETLPCSYPVISQDMLHLQAMTWGGGSEQWVTRTNDLGELIPFEYQLNAQSEYGSIDLDFAAVKKPLMINDSGFVYQGETAYSYYYSLTTLEVTGSITLNGFTEPVSGVSWLDRQYGTFNPSTGENYEWFSLQLSNGMDLNIWELFTPENSIPGTSAYRHFSIYINDSTAVSSSDFTLERLQYIFTPDQEQCYAKQWRFVHDTIDLTFTTRHDNQEVMLPFRFYEGSLEVSGLVGSEIVTGKGFAELLHRYQHPEISIDPPAGYFTEGGLYPVSWQLLNPDDGRPVYYDVEISLNENPEYETVAQHITDTVFFWDNSGIDPGTPFRVKVKGYSIDSTLSGSDSTSQALFTGIPDPSRDYISEQTLVYPNPAEDHFIIDGVNKPMSNLVLTLTNSQGRAVRIIENVNGNAVRIKRGNLPSGIYFYKISSGNIGVAGGKLILR